MIRPLNSPKVSFAGIAKLIGADYDQDFDVNGISLNADRKSTRLNSSHSQQSRMPSSA